MLLLEHTTMRIISLLALLFASNVGFAQQQSNRKPRLVVNIVVSQIRYDYLTRFADNLSDNGFRRFMREGVVCEESRYNYMQTNTIAALATLSTGVNPSMHGVVSERWIDNVNNRTIELVPDSKASGLDCDAGVGQFSPVNLTVPTLGDKLKEQSPKSKVITIAATPSSAVVMGGFNSDVYWIDDSRCNWISSNAYMGKLPEWVARYNALRVGENFLEYEWTLEKPRESYKNQDYSIVKLVEDSRFKKLMSLDFLKRKYISKEYSKILLTPAGNTLVNEFVKQAIIYEDLGKDDNTDLLNICFDTPRLVGELFGPESLETEDMFYRLDNEIGNLVDFIKAQVPEQELLIVLTSDHGASDSYNNSALPAERFNAAQFKMIVNAFLNTQYGSGEWVLDFVDRQLYLNRNLMYTNNLSIGEVQSRVAAFALQFRGVSHALTSTAMQSSYFGDGYGRLMQHGFYPKRSGDVTINLMPGWIEEDSEKRSLSGSMYDYDRHVPLMWLGCGLSSQMIRAPVDMTSIAPTLAYIMQIGRPIGSEAMEIEEIIARFK